MKTISKLLAAAPVIIGAIKNIRPWVTLILNTIKRMKK